MGLDMYLSAKRFLSEYLNKAQLAVIKPALAAIGAPAPYISNYDHCEIEVPLAYWRKANHIHAWFVANVQNGTDDCGYYDVEIDKLRELDKLCAEVVTSHDAKVGASKLPTQSGFFFGGTEYDDYYFEDCRQTMEALHKLLADHDAGKLEGWYIQYHSSW